MANAFDQLAEIIGPDLIRELVRVMPGAVIRIRKHPRYAKNIFYGDRAYYETMTIGKVAKKIGCSPRYIKKLRYARPYKR